MFTFYFIDKESGEEFFVEEYSLEAAIKIAEENFENPHFIEEVDEEFAEYMGFDTY